MTEVVHNVVEEKVVEKGKKEKAPKVHPTKYYKGTFSSPFAMEVLAKMGFQPLPENSREECSVYLFSTKNCSTKSSVLRKMTEDQRHSRFPKAQHLSQKSKLVMSFRKMAKTSDFVVDFLPKTFVLPDDWRSFWKHAAKEKRTLSAKNKGPENVAVGPWIVKPHDAAGGHGIFMIERLSQLSYIEVLQLVSKWKKIVVSRYISNPLLIGGLKFDMRLYVLVTSFTPLHIFIYSEGLARFCTESYPADGDISDPLAHLTNTSLNCHSEKFKYSNDIKDNDTGHTRLDLNNPERDHTWSLSSVLQYLEEQGINTKRIMIDIHDLTIKTFLAIQPTVAKVVTDCVPHKRNCFQLFGLDILLDDTLKPWLLEVNGNPALEPYTAMEVPIKARLVRDMFRIIGLYGEEKRRSKNRESRRKGQFELIFPKSIQKSRRKKYNLGDVAEKLDRQAEAKTEPDANTESEAKTEPEVKTEPEEKTEPEAKTEPEVKTEAVENGAQVKAATPDEKTGSDEKIEAAEMRETGVAEN